MKKRSSKVSRKGKSVSVDGLALMVGKGFKELSGEMNSRFSEMDGRIDVLEEKINTVNANVLALQYDYKKIVFRIENLELKAFGSVQE